MWRYLLPFALFIALAVLLASGIGKDTRLVPSPLIDRPAPIFSLPDLLDSNAQVGNAELRGRPYLLNVWASWCFACREEHPVLMRLAATGKVAIIGYNWKDEPEAALAVLRQSGNPYTRIAADQEGRVAIDFGVYGAPETFVVDAQGTIIHKHIGPLDWAAVEREILPRLAVKEAP
ncbi:MAG: DsbE family thiol:disulfide interchange protein [Lysobacterales bacterium]